MSRRRRDAGSSPAEQSYDRELADAMARFLPHRGLPLLSEDGRVRFTARLLATLAVLMAWSPLPTLIDRFAQARAAVVRAYATRRRPGGTCEGFARAMVTHGAAVLDVLAEHWRRCVRELAGAGWWAVEGWALFGFDGTTVDCPRTAANEEGFGVSGKDNSGPQQLLTCPFHVATGMLWGWTRGGIRGDGERTQLRRLLGLLPDGAMLLADAGVAGYELFADLLSRGGHFLVRVGGNVKLIRKLGHARREGRQTVYLWPLDRQGRRHGGRRSPMPRSLANVRPPLVLRLIELRDAAGRPVFLLTDVTDRRRLTDAAAARMYRLRWGVEVMWRGLKQTMGHRKLLLADAGPRGGGAGLGDGRAVDDAVDRRRADAAVAACAEGVQPGADAARAARRDGRRRRPPATPPQEPRRPAGAGEAGRVRAEGE